MSDKRPIDPTLDDAPAIEAIDEELAEIYELYEANEVQKSIAQSAFLLGYNQGITWASNRAAHKREQGNGQS